MKISEALNCFYNIQLVRGNQLDTIRAYKSHLKPFIKYTNDTDIKNIDYEMYCNYIIHLRDTRYRRKLSSVTIHSYANSLKCFLRFLYENKLIENNIAYEIKRLPKQLYTIPKIIAPEQIQIILNNLNLKNKIDSRNALILVLCYDIGFRLSELIRLNVQDLDFDNRLIRITGKANKQRNVPMTDTIKYYLFNYLSFYKRREKGQLLLDWFDKPIKKSAIISWFKRTKKKYNLISFYPHLLRHSFATLFLKNGGDSIILQDILGHSTLEMTKKYIHLANSLNMSSQKMYSPLSQSKKIKKETSYQTVRSPTNIYFLNPH